MKKMLYCLSVIGSKNFDSKSKLTNQVANREQGDKMMNYNLMEYKKI